MGRRISNQIKDLGGEVQYLAMGAGVPIIPVALDYPTKTVRFLEVCYPTGDYQADLAVILSAYRGIEGRHPSQMAQVLQDLKLP